MQKILKGLTIKSLKHPQKNLITTTLYDLIEAVEEEAQKNEKGLVPEIVVGLLKNYQSNCWTQ